MIVYTMCHCKYTLITKGGLSLYRPVAELTQQLACIVTYSTVLQQQLGIDHNEIIIPVPYLAS